MSVHAPGLTGSPLACPVSVPAPSSPVWPLVVSAQPRLLLDVAGVGRRTLPGHVWPEVARAQREPVGVCMLTRREVNALLERWEHPLGAYERPFGYQAWGLRYLDELVAAAVSGSTVSATVRTERRDPESGDRVPGPTYQRREVVELARIARKPKKSRAMRVMLRAWTDVLAPLWPYWSPTAAVSYAVPGRPGDVYRFDGWWFAGERRPSGGGGSWSSPSRTGRGRKRLFVFDYEECEA